MKRLLAVALIVVSAVLFGFQAQAANEIVVGCISDLTGTYAALSKQQVDAVNMAVDELNKKGGVIGKKLRVVVEDSATSVSLATQKLERLILDQKVDFVIPPTTSSAVLAMMPVALKYNKLMMVTLAQSMKITGENRNKVTFRCFGNGEITGKPQSKWMVKNLGKKYYIIGADYAWPRSTAEVYTKFLKQNGAEIIGETWFPLGTKDFASYFGKVKAAKPEVLLMICAGNDAVSLVSQVKQYGLGKQMKLAADGSLVSADIIKAHGSNADGIIIADFYVSSMDTPENKVFVKNYMARYKDAPSKMALSSYEGVMWVAQAIKQVGSTDTDKLVKAIEGSTYKGPQGSKKMGPDHQAVLDVYMIQIANGGQYKILERAN
ncbi:MAG: ABC transporter substrate-binding protein [Syntrophorhabdus sp.]|nr:ABC transporter substrate-binding protein [Syntrophorhabdus sp.]